MLCDQQRASKVCACKQASETAVDVRRAAALNRIIANDPFDQQLEAVLSPALGPLLSAIGRTPALSNAIASALNDKQRCGEPPCAPLEMAPSKLAFCYLLFSPADSSKSMGRCHPGNTSGVKPSCSG